MKESVFAPALDGRSLYDLAIETIRHYARPDGKNLVAFSGGKDSQAVLHLCREGGGGVFRGVFRHAVRAAGTVGFPPRPVPGGENPPGLQEKPVGGTRVLRTAQPLGAVVLQGEARQNGGFPVGFHWRPRGGKRPAAGHLADVWPEAGRDVLLLPHLPLDGGARLGILERPRNPALPPLRRRLFPDWLRPLPARGAKGPGAGQGAVPENGCHAAPGAERFVERMRSQGWRTARGKPCADWCKAADPVAEYFSRWIATRQTTMPAEEFAKTEADLPGQCVFAGSGFSEADAGEE